MIDGVELTLSLRAGVDRFVAGPGAEDGQTAGVHQTEGSSARIKILSIYRQMWDPDLTMQAVRGMQVERRRSLRSVLVSRWVMATLWLVLA